MKKKCCGFGHRNIYINIDSKIEKILIDLIENKFVDLFYKGGMGDFDKIFSTAVRKLKKKYVDIKLILVYPYFTNDINVNKEFYNTNYDSILIPEEFAGAHYKRAIKLRNKWMIDNSEFVISCVNRNFGGAYEAVKYAKKSKKKIFNIN